MKLRPLQIVGLVAVVVFGGYLIYTLTRPKPDPFVVPGAAPVAAAVPSPAGGNLPGSAETLPAQPEEPPAPIDQPLEVGSQETRDDLYCAGLLEAANPVPQEALVPTEEGRIFKARMQAISLRLTASAMLVEEGAAHDSQVDRIADAWAKIAERDIDTGDHKITLEECADRADALPPG
jgi:hypothetical protein